MKVSIILFLSFMSFKAQALLCRHLFTESTNFIYFESGKGQTSITLFARAQSFLNPEVLRKFNDDLRRVGSLDRDAIRTYALLYSNLRSHQNFLNLYRALERTVVVAIRPFLHRVDLDTYFDLYQEATVRLSRKIETATGEGVAMDTPAFYSVLAQALERAVERFLELQVRTLLPEYDFSNPAQRLWVQGLRLTDVALLAQELGLSFETALELMASNSSSMSTKEIESMSEGLRVGVSELLLRLTPVEERVIRSIHLLHQSLDEVANTLSISRERVRQIEMRAMRKLRIIFSNTEDLRGNRSNVETRALSR